MDEPATQETTGCLDCGKTERTLGSNVASVLHVLPAQIIRQKPTRFSHRKSSRNNAGQLYGSTILNSDGVGEDSG